MTATLLTAQDRVQVGTTALGMLDLVQKWKVSITALKSWKAMLGNVICKTPDLSFLRRTPSVCVTDAAARVSLGKAVPIS